MDILLFGYMLVLGLICIFLAASPHLVRERKLQNISAQQAWEKLDQIEHDHQDLRRIIEALDQKRYSRCQTEPIKTLDKFETLSLRKIAARHK